MYFLKNQICRYKDWLKDFFLVISQTGYYGSHYLIRRQFYEAVKKSKLNNFNAKLKSCLF